GFPSIVMYPPSAKTKDKVDKKHIIYMVTRITQAFAVYPDRPELINQSSLFKVEGTIKDEQHLFLDRELAEVLDPRIYETSQVRGSLMNILIQRSGGPSLPPLNFDGAQPDHSQGRSMLSTIREQSTFSTDNRMDAPGANPMQNGVHNQNNPPQPLGAQNARPQEINRPPTAPGQDTSAPHSPGSFSQTSARQAAGQMGQRGNDGRTWSPTPSNSSGRPQITIPGSQPPPNMAVNNAQRTGSPLSVVNGNQQRQDPSRVDTPNHQHLPSIPSMRTPPAAGVANPMEASHPGPNGISMQQSTSWNNAPVTSAPANTRPNGPPASQPQEQRNSQIYNEEGALYMLSQMDEPPEVSPLQNLPPQPLPPRLAALERHRANSGSIDDAEPSPFASTSNTNSPFASTGSFAAAGAMAPHPNAFSNAFASGSGNVNATRNTPTVSEGLARMTSEYDRAPQGQTKIVQSQKSTSSLPRPADQSSMNATNNLGPPRNESPIARATVTASPLPLSAKPAEETEDVLHNADALAALTFAESPDLPE
ncbi:3163_t:CDS:2, partial [Acaulospora colombiana]